MTHLADKLLSAKTFVVHENCADGMAAAMLLHEMNRDAEVVFCQYSTSQHKQLPATTGMVFADFSPPADRVEEFRQVGAVVLDHHHTQQAVVEAFGEDGVYSDEPGVCGATLVYRAFWQPLVHTGAIRNDVPLRDKFAAKLATLAGVYDTWQTQSPLWEEAHTQAEVLRFLPPESLLEIPFTLLVERWDSHFLWLGGILRKKGRTHVSKVIDGGYRFTTQRGTRGIILSSRGSVTNDAAEALGSEVDLVISAFYAYDSLKDSYPKVVLSCRSKTDYDVSKLCKFYGGGGHAKAAAVTLGLAPGDPQLYTFVQHLVRGYEENAH